MRVRIIFLLKNRGAFIPFHHQYLLAQLLKAVVMVGGDPDFLAFRKFNFSGLKGQTKSSRKGLHYYSSRVTLVLASHDEGFIDYVLLHMFKMQQLHLGDLTLEPEKVEVEVIPDLANYEKFICLSPLVLAEPSLLDDKAKQFVDPVTDTFSDQLYDLAMQDVESQNLFNEDKLATFNEFQIVPDTAYLAKLEENNKKFSRVYAVYDQDIKFEVRGYTFPFFFYGAPELKRALFIDGLGSLPHKGFGMIDLANEDPNDRVQPYDIPGI